MVLQTPTGEAPATAPQLRASYPLQNVGALAKTSDQIGVKTGLLNETAFKNAPRVSDGQGDPPPQSYFLFASILHFETTPFRFDVTIRAVSHAARWLASHFAANLI